MLDKLRASHSIPELLLFSVGSCWLRHFHEENLADHWAFLGFRSNRQKAVIDYFNTRNREPNTHSGADARSFRMYAIEITLFSSL
ncbi:hypothetical protein WL80_07240 [Burkholderia ubonensis]|nr:hypothetical protein WL80_07240 [Burkholderia ubonensis]